MCQMCMTDADTTQDNFILPALPVGGLPISQDRLDRMKLVRNHTIPIILPSGKNILIEREREMFYLTTHSTHFIYGYIASDIWLRTIMIVRKETRCRHIGYSYRLTARVLLYAPSHRQDNTYHGLCYTSRGALAGTRNSSMGILIDTMFKIIIWYTNHGMRQIQSAHTHTHTHTQTTEITVNNNFKSLN